MLGTNCSGFADTLLPALDDLFNSCIRHKTVKYMVYCSPIYNVNSIEFASPIFVNEPKAHSKVLLFL
jgi:hypothetical protein